MTRRIAILGSTGSIGTSALDVIAHLGSSYQVAALSAHHQTDLLLSQAKKFVPHAIAVTGKCDEEKIKQSVGCDVNFGDAALVDLVSRDDVDVVLSAIIGAAGLSSSIAAIEAGKTLLLANKESLVIGGALLMPLVRKKNATILPIDSEHSAVFQSMLAGKRSEIKRVILTASGGPFLNSSIEEMHNATPEDALKHPTWNMGNKITIDSATMFNKAAEIIEAVWLFDLDPSQVEVVIHRESIIHSMVEFVDGSMIAQLSPPDMKTPIQYALTYPDRLPGCSRRMDFTSAMSLNFAPPDLNKFPALKIAYDVATRGGTLGAVMNASKEMAVDAFLSGKIRLGAIQTTVAETIAQHKVQEVSSLADVIKADQWARTTANTIIDDLLKA